MEVAETWKGSYKTQSGQTTTQQQKNEQSISIWKNPSKHTVSFLILFWNTVIQWVPQDPRFSSMNSNGHLFTQRFI